MHDVGNSERVILISMVILVTYGCILTDDWPTPGMSQSRASPTAQAATEAQSQNKRWKYMLI